MRPRRIDGGFSLLEMLLVIALMVTLTSLAIPYWRAQQLPVQRQLAWLQLQQLLLAQQEYLGQTGSYAEDLSLLPTMKSQLGYDYRIESAAGLWLQAQVLNPGPQVGDEQCWQLWLSEDGEQRSYDRQGKQTFACE